MENKLIEWLKWLNEIEPMPELEELDSNVGIGDP